MTQAFLPFSKPLIDEATIAAVGDVLRSGWITSGPKVQAFEAALSAYFGGRPVRTFNSGTCTMEIALAHRRHRRRRRSDHHADFLGRHRQRDPRSRRHAGVRRHRPGHAQHRPRQAGSRHHAAHPRHHPGLPVRPAGRHGPAVRDRRQAQAARGRRRGAGPRLDLARQAHRLFRRFRLLQLPGQQERHHRPKAAAWC